jgi:transposase
MDVFFDTGSASGTAWLPAAAQPAASVAQRMRIILQLADGAIYSEIQEGLGVAATTIARWKKRYEEDGLTGLAIVHPGQFPRLFTPELRAKILALVKEPPPDGSTHWSLRKAAKVLWLAAVALKKVVFAASSGSSQCSQLPRTKMLFQPGTVPVDRFRVPHAGGFHAHLTTSC